MWALLPAAAGVALVASVELGRAAGGVGTYRGAQVNAEQELAVLGAANAAAGVLGGLPSATSYSRSSSARGAGATTQVFQLVTAAESAGQDAPSDAVVTVSSPALADFALGRISYAELLQAGAVQVDGDERAQDAAAFFFSAFDVAPTPVYLHAR